MNKIIYGLSGSLKMTTIKSKYIGDDYFIVYSDTKKFFDYDKNFFNWSAGTNNAHICTERLIILDQYLPPSKTIVCERGISDFIFSIPEFKIKGLESYDSIEFNKLLNLETKFLGGETNIYRELLVMNDDDFIINEVLNENKDGYYRKRLYQNLSIYKKKQDEYIKFTTDNNKMNKITIIDNAFDYINKLK